MAGGDGARRMRGVRGRGGARPASPRLPLLLLLLLARAAGGRSLQQAEPGARGVLLPGARGVLLPGARQNVEQSPDGCDRTVWSAPGEPRAVHQLQVRCAEGALSWQQADGALRVHLDAPGPVRAGRELETCLRVSAHLLRVVVSAETPGGGLTPLALLSRDAPETSADVCMRTARPLTLYLETQPGGPHQGLGFVKIRYDVSSVSQNQADNMEECRPCTQDELLLAVCSMDFAVSGRMETVLHSSVLQQTTLSIRVSRVYRQKGRHFSEPRETPRDASRETSRDASREAAPGVGRGTIVAPYKCGIRYGQGDFLFVGRMRLGRALLQCAPRMEEFEAVWARSMRTGRNQCVLD